MSRGRFITWLVLLAVVALIALAWFSFREPRARGESLSYWLRQGVSTDGLGMVERNSPESEAAIRDIGTKAIPTLLAKLRATDPPWKEKTYEWLNKQDFYKFEPTWEQEERAQGLYGFTVLGSNALSALPELEKMFWDTNTSWAAAGALGELGLSSLPILRAGFTNAETVIRSAAVYGTSPTNLATATLPDMRPLLHDPDLYVSFAAFMRLMQLAPRTEATTLAIDILQTNRTRLRGTALNQLSRSNIDTNEVIPVLVRLLNDPDPDPRFRMGVTNALKRLDLVAAAAAGIDTNPPPIRGRDPRDPRRRGRAPAVTNTPAAPLQ
jgi:hypothetical protein